LAYQVGIKDHTPKGGTQMPKIEELIPPKIFQEIQEKLREQEKKKPKKRRNRLKPGSLLARWVATK
jgi:hypothetical protein